MLTFSGQGYKLVYIKLSIKKLVYIYIYVCVCVVYNTKDVNLYNN